MPKARGSKARGSKATASAASAAQPIETLRADFAALARAVDPKDEGKMWWNYLDMVGEGKRIARVKGMLRLKLPFTDDDLAELLEHTAYIQNGMGGLAQHDPTPALLKAAGRALSGRRPRGRLRKALASVRKNLRAANPSVQRLREQANALLTAGAGS
jgi:hypothetical protein